MLVLYIRYKHATSTHKNLTLSKIDEIDAPVEVDFGVCILPSASLDQLISPYVPRYAFINNEDFKP